MLANLGKENEGADIEGIFQTKLATRTKKDKVLVNKLLFTQNKEKENKT